MHRFDIRVSSNGSVFLFCMQCGLSYRHTEFHGTGRTAWIAIDFTAPDGTLIDPPEECRCPDPYAEAEREREAARAKARE